MPVMYAYTFFYHVSVDRNYSAQLKHTDCSARKLCVFGELSIQLHDKMTSVHSNLYL